MPEASRRKTHSGALRQRAELLVASALALAVGAFVFALGAAIAPPAFENLSSRASDGVWATPISDRAAVVVPEGWLVSASGPMVRTPDAALRVRFDIGEGEAESALAGMIPDAANAGPIRAETLASGLSVVHCDIGEESVYAVVTTSSGESVRIIATVFEPHSIDDYRPALAQLLAGVTG